MACVSDLRGLVVDWGGVLTPSLDGAMAAWARHDGVRFEHFEQALHAWTRPVEDAASGPVDGVGGVGDGRGAQEPVAALEQAEGVGWSPVHRLERGELSVPDFERALAAELARLGSPVEPQGLLRRMLGGLDDLEEDMIGLVRRAHAAGLRTALLSNSWGDGDYPAQLWDGLFDELVISGRVGMRKPDPDIFRYTCSLLDLPPSACVMVDDLPRNIAGAVRVGMVGVLHRAYASTVEELEILFGVPLR